MSGTLEMERTAVRPAAVAAPADGYWDLPRLKRAYSDYLGSKDAEIQEQKDSRRYYHGAQWTAEQLKELRRRKQPAMTYNRIARKINGVVGVIERLRQDPKAFPRTPMHEQGAELATATLRYILDAQDWRAKSPEVAMDGAIDGIGGIEIIIEKGDEGDPDIGFEVVEPDSFFYDPVSYKQDFSDARYMGLGKWVDPDTLADLGFDAATGDTGSDDLSTDSDRENKWFITDTRSKRIRLVDCWYKARGGWKWAIFTGSRILAQGDSYLKDEKGKPDCKFKMFSAFVDHDGDRYGFIRGMKSPQDSVNAKKSKMQHIMASRRLIMRQGAVADDNIETVRSEWAKPDGVVVVNGMAGPLENDIKADDQSPDFVGWAKLLELDMAEMENFGPNMALIGQGNDNQSGRAIALLQQAGISELGPYMLAYRGWKVRVYRALWNAARTHWTAERAIRITDDEGLAQFVKLNQLGINPQTGLPAIINQLGALDVDIILDEGPDNVSMMQDSYETLMAMGPDTPPELRIEMSPLPGSLKKRLLDKLKGIQEAQASQPNPEALKIQAEMQAKQADTELHIRKTQADIEAKAQDVQIKQASAAADLQIAREKHFAELQMQRERLDAEMQRNAVKVAAQVESQRIRDNMRAASHAGRVS